jgi:hypothetical protein
MLDREIHVNYFRAGDANLCREYSRIRSDGADILKRR